LRDSYNYCTREWCVHNEDDSCFGYEEGTEWNDFYGCQESYDPTAEQKVNNPSPECAQCCAPLNGKDEYEACLLECEEGTPEDCKVDIENGETLADVEKKCPDTDEETEERSGPNPAPPKDNDEEIVTITVCVEEEGNFSMEEIPESSVDGQPSLLYRPGDVIEIKGVKHFLGSECEPLKVVEVCTEDSGTYTMEEILESSADGELMPGDEVVIDGVKHTLTSNCDVVQNKSGPGPSKGSGSGDPHFKTWTGDKYDYHGECDLVLVDHPSFMDGLGLRVHIRTTRVKYFSYIEQVAVQIGQDVLEFNNDVENFLINGKQAEANRKHHKTHLSGFVVSRLSKSLSIRLHDEGRYTQVAKIDLHARRNGFPAVIVDGGNTELFKGSLGLLGDWETGKRIARDGETELGGHDATEFALEWQVRDTEPALFQESRFPQYPTICNPPAAMPDNRLGSTAFQKEAEEACAHWKEDKEDCIFDVIATRDVLVAEEGHIVHVQ